MKSTHIGQVMHPFLAHGIEHLQKTRAKAKSADAVFGVNFCILVAASCFLEGSFECVLRGMAYHRKRQLGKLQPAATSERRDLNLYIKRLSKDISDRITETTGAAAYDSLFETLSGEPLSKLAAVAPLWEGITILFNYRNVLAHGREIWALREEGAKIPGGSRETFKGGYKKVEDYLIKRKLAKANFLQDGTSEQFLSNEVADHFWGLAKKVPAAISESFKGELRDICELAISDPSPLR